MHIFDRPEDLHTGAAAYILRIVAEALQRRAMATLALTGGRTALHVYEAMVRDPSRERVDWSRVHVFWGDERAVPPDDRDSNFLMADQALLAGLPLPKSNVHRIAGERSPEEAATLYELEIRRVVGGDLPVLDLVLLSMGEDGHVASLFPGMTELDDDRRVALAVSGPKPPSARVSLTMRTINAARHIVVLVSGSSKAAALAQARGEAGEFGHPRLPAALLAPKNGHLSWLVDRDAAGELNDQMATSG